MCYPIHSQPPKTPGPIKNSKPPKPSRLSRHFNNISKISILFTLKLMYSRLQVDGINVRPGKFGKNN